MAQIDLAQLGLTPTQLRDMVVERLVAQIRETKEFDPEDDAEYTVPTSFAKRVSELAKEHIDAKLQALCEEHLLPNVDKYVGDLVLTETNRWGEPNGHSWTVTEYLVEKCNQYMLERVDFEGKGKQASGFGWKGSQTRLEWMVATFLDKNIENSVKEWLAAAHKQLGASIEDTVKAKMKEITAALKISVTQPR